MCVVPAGAYPFSTQRNDMFRARPLWRGALQCRRISKVDQDRRIRCSDCNANADANYNLMVVETERSADCLNEASCKSGRIVRLFDAALKDREFVAPQAGEGVAFTQTPLHSSGD